jgi:membrane dipeptidase
MVELNEQVQDILRENLVIDTLSHGPILWTEPLLKATDEMIAANLNPFKIVQELLTRFSEKVVADDDYLANLIQAWKKSGVNAVSWTLGPIYEKPYSLEGVWHNFALMTHIIDNRRSFFVKVLKSADLSGLKQNNKIGIIYNLQDMGFIGTQLEMVKQLYMMGFRIMQLTYNGKNTLGTGCTARRDKGLTEFGKSVVKEINRLGAIIDVSHCGPQTSLDAANHSEMPIIASHTIAQHVNIHDRAKSDELLTLIAEKGGYLGVLTVPGFLTTNPKTTIEDWLDHVDYIINLVGIEHVGIGTDYYGYSVPDNLAAKIGEFMDLLGFRPEHKASFLDKMVNFENYSKFPNLINGLLSRGYSKQEISKIVGENFFRFFKSQVG